MQVIERVSTVEAAACGLLGALNAAFFATRAGSGARPRRLAAGTLVLVNAALSLEALLYLAILRQPASALESMATIGLRSLLLAAVVSISVLAFRGREGLGARR